MTKEELAALLKEAAEAHHKFEETLGKADEDWPTWYANFMHARIEDAFLLSSQPMAG